MHGSFLNREAARSLLAIVLGVALFVSQPEAAAAANAIQLSAEVPAGKSKALRLRKLPRDAILSVRVRSSGSLQIALVSAAQFRSNKPQALFRGALERSLTFQVTIPEAGDYYVVLDNRQGKQSVKTQTTISASKGPQRPAEPSGRPDKDRGKEKIEKTRAALVPHA